MNRRQLMRLAALSGLAGGLAACGIDTADGVVVDGPGPSGGAGGGGESINPPSREAATNPVAAIESFLAAPAGLYESRRDRIREFIAPAEVRDWTPSSDAINVVQLIDKVEPIEKEGKDGNTWYEQRLDVVQIGVLTPTGWMDPPIARSTSYLIKVSNHVDGGKGGYYVLNPPKDILLSDLALSRYYASRCIYFWNSAGTGLVPDLRYVSRAIDGKQHRDQLVDWLVSGPSTWLAGATKSLPKPPTKKIGKVIMTEGRLVVNLSAEAKPDVDKLLSQLRWTLRRELEEEAAELTLEIESESIANLPKATVRDYLADNPSWRQPGEPRLYAIENGAVVSVGGDAPRHLTGGPEDNSQVDSAAIVGDRAIALVRRQNDGQRRLYFGPRSDFGPGLRDSGLFAAEMSRPAWIGAESVLIAAGGHLHQVWRLPDLMRRVNTPGIPDPITWVALGPDDRRVALIAGGRLYLAALRSGGSGANVTLDRARLVNTSLRGLTCVAFGSEDRLVIAGRGPRGYTRIAGINVDGAVRDWVVTDEVALGQATVHSIATYPLNPGVVGAPMVVFGKGQDAYRVVSGTPVELTGLPSPSPLPSHSPTPGTGTVRGAALINPFFAE